MISKRIDLRGVNNTRVCCDASFLLEGLCKLNGMTILIPSDLKRYTVLGNISILITH